MNSPTDQILRRLMLCGVVLILVYALATAWVYEIWATLVAQAAVIALFLPLGVLCFVRSGWPARAWTVIPVAGAALFGIFQLGANQTVDRFVTEVLVIRLSSMVLATLIGLYLFADRTFLSRFRRFLFWMGVVFSALAIVQLHFADGRIVGLVRSPHTLLPMGTFLSRDSYAAFIELILPVALWRAGCQPWKWRYSIGAAVMYASVIVCLSRAGSVLASLELLAVPLLALWLHRQRHASNAVRRVVSVIALSLVLATLFGWQDLFKRFDTQDAWQIRREYFASSLSMVHTHPFIGFGLGSWPIVYPRFAIVDMGAASLHAHNDWIEWASDGGIPYMVLLLIPILYGCKQALRHPWGLGVLAVSVHALVDFPFQVYPLLLLFFLLIGALQAAQCSRLHNKESACSGPEASAAAWGQRA